jgi:hypothetical protein
MLLLLIFRHGIAGGSAAFMRIPAFYQEDLFSPGLSVSIVCTFVSTFTIILSVSYEVRGGSVPPWINKEANIFGPN